MVKSKRENGLVKVETFKVTLAVLTNKKILPSVFLANWFDKISSENPGKILWHIEDKEKKIYTKKESNPRRGPGRPTMKKRGRPISSKNGKKRGDNK